MSTLLEPFEFAFFRNGMIVGALAGALLALLGVFVVLRGMSYIGHGLSHAILGWAVASYVVGINFYVGAFAGGFVAAGLVDRVSRRRTLGADAAIGVVTTISFAVGLLLIATRRGFARSFDAALFGNVLGVRGLDVAVVAAVMASAALFVFFGYRRLLFATFDPEVAQASGVNISRLDALYALMLAAGIVATMNVIGVLLVAAGLVIPAATARLLTDSFSRMIWISVLLGAVSGIAGMYLSWFRDWPSGPTIVLTQGALFLGAYAFSGARGRLRSLPSAHGAA